MPRAAPRRPSGATVDASFMYGQRDLFSSGLVAEVGPLAFTVWQAVKWHADYSTGRSFPSVRRLADMCGINRETVSKCLHVLAEAKLLKWQARGRGRSYIARERLDVRIGDRVICTVLLDYVPSRIRDNATAIAAAVQGKEPNAAMAELGELECEIVPGPGFVWDPESGTLKGKLPASALPQAPRTEVPPEIRKSLDQLLKKRLR